MTADPDMPQGEGSTISGSQMSVPSPNAETAPGHGTTTAFERVVVGRARDFPPPRVPKVGVAEKTETTSPRAGMGGPKSAAGKLLVSQNAVKHGGNSLNPVAGGESLQDWEVHLAGFFDRFQPLGVVEEEIVTQMAMTTWRWRRVIRAESAAINARYEAIEDPDSYPPLPEQEPTQWRTTLEPVEALRPKNAEATITFIDALIAGDAIDPHDQAAWVAGLDNILDIAGPADIPDPTGPVTRGSVIDYLTKAARAQEQNLEDYLYEVRGVAVNHLAELGQNQRDRAKTLQNHTKAMERTRRRLEQAAILPPPDIEQRLQRLETHLAKQFEKLMSQLETLQRARSGADLPPPVRVQVLGD